MESPQIVLAISVGMSALDAVDGSSTGTEVPWMWVLLRPPRFGGAKHASGHDNRSRYRQVCFSNMQPRVKEKAPRRRGPNSEPKRREGCVPTNQGRGQNFGLPCLNMGVSTPPMITEGVGRERAPWHAPQGLTACLVKCAEAFCPRPSFVGRS
jgi:hypothetical protein